MPRLPQGAEIAADAGEGESLTVRSFVGSIALVLVLTVLACRPVPDTELHRQALQLKAGMTLTTVEEMFRHFGRSQTTEFKGKPGDAKSVQDPAVIFLPEVAEGSKISYWPKESKFFAPWFEYCEVYFGTNEVIVGYRYAYDR